MNYLRTEAENDPPTHPKTLTPQANCATYPSPMSGPLDPEPRRDLPGRGDLRRHQLHRSQPPTGPVGAGEGKADQPEHEHHATVRTLQQPHRRTDRTGLRWQQGQYRLTHPTHPAACDSHT